MALRMEALEYEERTLPECNKCYRPAWLEDHHVDYLGREKEVMGQKRNPDFTELKIPLCPECHMVSHLVMARIVWLLSHKNPLSFWLLCSLSALEDEDFYYVLKHQVGILETVDDRIALTKLGRFRKDAILYYVLGRA